MPKRKPARLLHRYHRDCRCNFTMPKRKRVLLQLDRKHAPAVATLPCQSGNDAYPAVPPMSHVRCNFTMPKRKRGIDASLAKIEISCNFTMPKRKLLRQSGTGFGTKSCNFTMPKRKRRRAARGRCKLRLQLYHAKAETHLIGEDDLFNLHSLQLYHAKAETHLIGEDDLFNLHSLQLYHAKAETLLGVVLVSQSLWVATLPCQSGNKAA